MTTKESVESNDYHNPRNNKLFLFLFSSNLFLFASVYISLLFAGSILMYLCLGLKVGRWPGIISEFLPDGKSPEDISYWTKSPRKVYHRWRNSRIKVCCVFSFELNIFLLLGVMVLILELHSKVLHSYFTASIFYIYIYVLISVGIVLLWITVFIQELLVIYWMNSQLHSRVKFNISLLKQFFRNFLKFTVIALDVYSLAICLKQGRK